MVDVLELAHRMRRQGEPLVLATVVRRRAPSSGKPGCSAVIDSHGVLHGWVGGACAGPAVVREALRALREGTPRLVLLGTAPGAREEAGEGLVSLPMTCQSEGALEVFLEPILPRPLLAVVGRSPAVEALAGMAGALGWNTVTVDPEPEEGRPGVDRDLAGAGVSEGSYVVVATQGHDDEDWLEWALSTGAAYVGLVASRRRAEGVLDVLRERGASEASLARVHAPAGLDLGRITNPEIAVAILAELVQQRAAAAPAAAIPPPAAAAEAVDPVCGMTVDMTTARQRTSHQGVDYWFCAAACRTRFLADPGSYIDAPLALAKETR
jgi:xanthine dehydrogenase accessory factor